MDKRVLKTRQRITDAFIELIKTKEINKITVSELAKKADIERKTFYLHYNCIEDVYLDIETSITKELEDEANKYFDNPNYKIKNVFYTLNSVINNHIDFFKTVSNNDSYSFLLSSFEKALSRTIYRIATEICHVTSKNTKYYTDYYASGIVKLYTSWIKGEYDLTLDELTIILTRVSFLSVDELIKRK